MTGQRAGCFGIGISFCFPLIGVIMYFCMKNKVENASSYLKAAGAGFLIATITSILRA